MRVMGQGYIYAMSKTIFDMTAVKNIVKTVIKWIILSKTSRIQYLYNKYILCDKHYVHIYKQVLVCTKSLAQFVLEAFYGKILVSIPLYF